MRERENRKKKEKINKNHLLKGNKFFPSPSFLFGPLVAWKMAPKRRIVSSSGGESSGSLGAATSSDDDSGREAAQEMNFICPSCPRAFKQNGHLIRHVNAKHGGWHDFLSFFLFS